MAKQHDHAMTFRILNWQVCSKCGLIALKNERTRKALRKPCPGTPDD
jgi:hypothetical protein